MTPQEAAIRATAEFEANRNHHNARLIYMSQLYGLRNIDRDEFLLELARHAGDS